MTARLTVTDAPSAEAVAVIEHGLGDYNREQAGYWDSRPLAVLVREPVAEPAESSRLNPNGDTTEI